MNAKVNKFLAVTAAVVGIAAIIPMDAMAWWKVDVFPKSGPSYSAFIDVGGMYHGQTAPGSVFFTIQIENYLFFLAGAIILIGAIMLLAGGIKFNKIIVAIGGILVLSGPVIFLIAHGTTSSFLTQADYLGNYNLFFGSGPTKWDGGDGMSNWYLGIGFYVALAAGGLGILNWRLKWQKPAQPVLVQSEPEEMIQEDDGDQAILAEINKGKLPPEGESQPDKDSAG
ncbi:MAG: hypothetical protein Q6373_004920 [Candidatus Sigynarchaeota archaeon]